jgi:hypothetical protein
MRRLMLVLSNLTGDDSGKTISIVSPSSRLDAVT